MKRSVQELYSEATIHQRHSFIRQILSVTKNTPGLISLAGGLPNPKSFPKDLLARLFSQVVLEDGDDVLQYGASIGDKVLIDVLKVYEEAAFLGDEEIIITVGSTNAIYYYTRALINPGDVIVCEAPTFPGSIVSMEACGARLEGVGMDDDGMNPAELRAQLTRLLAQKEKVKYIYVIPEFQNPSGRTMTLARRREIVKIALEFDIPILEDQPYRELRFEGERIITMWELARTEFGETQLVTIAKSFSKILGAGLRLGFASGPAGIIEQMTKWAQKVTVSPDCVTQRVAARFIQQGHIQGHIRNVNNLYRPRRDAMLAALKEFMPGNVRWTTPEGGMFVWITMADSVDTQQLFDKAIQNKVAFIPGINFYPEGIVKKNELRLNFSYPDEAQIHEGVRRLSQLCCH